VSRPSIVVLQQAEVIMLVTLVAILCSNQLCLEKVVTNSEQSGIRMAACQANAQIGITNWFANGPYHEWKLEGYKRFGQIHAQAGRLMRK
jgi:hypothetical protein